jgi:hypothetical protein
MSTEDFVSNPFQKLVLLERKIGALDRAAPRVVVWELPEEFATLLRLLGARLGKHAASGSSFKSCACWKCSEPMIWWAGVRK